MSGRSSSRSIAELAPLANLVGGVWQSGPHTFDVLDKFTLDCAATLGGADDSIVGRAIDHAVEAAELARRAPGHERAALLDRVVELVEVRRPDFERLISIEAGFPVTDASGEVGRALQTLHRCAEEARRIEGETVPFDGSVNGVGRMGFTMRVPIGVVAAITPFNSPLNTVCHKVGPAIAAGNAVVLKPSDKTPLTASLLAWCFFEAGAPSGLVSVVHGGPEVAQTLLSDERIGFFAFTGSTEVGRIVKARAGLRRTQLELGSIAATVIMSDSDLDVAASKCVRAGFRKAGQVCTSIQLLMVERSAMSEIREAMVNGASSLCVGDPLDPTTELGPMISVDAATRVEALLARRDSDAEAFVLEGSREGAVLSPSIIEGITTESRFFQEEIFGPVVCLLPVHDIDDAVSHINHTPYGLATGVFTNSISTAFAAARNLRVGSVHINETSSSRVDLMPYGGVKDSGSGHEGPKYAMQEMSDERLMTFAGISAANSP